MLSFLLASTVLFVGDSHSVGPYGWALDRNLRAQGHSVVTVGSCGSIAKWWVQSQKTTCGYFSKDIDSKLTQRKSQMTPKIQILLDQVKPQVVVIELGSNYVKTPNDEFVRADIKNLIRIVKASGAQCFWVTPPDMRLYRSQIPRLNRLINEAVGGECAIFDSQAVTNYPTEGGDGVHYWFDAGQPLAELWAEETAKAFDTFSKSEAPPKTTEGPKTAPDEPAVATEER